MVSIRTCFGNSIFKVIYLAQKSEWCLGVVTSHKVRKVFLKKEADVDRRASGLRSSKTVKYRADNHLCYLSSLACPYFNFRYLDTITVIFNPMR